MSLSVHGLAIVAENVKVLRSLSVQKVQAGFLTDHHHNSPGAGQNLMLQCSRTTMFWIAHKIGQHCKPPSPAELSLMQSMALLLEALLDCWIIESVDMHF